MTATKKVRVGFACNNPDNGLFTGVVAGIAVSAGDEDITLDHISGGAPRLSVDSGHIRVFRRNFSIHGAQNWVGNWCWNEYVLALPDAARLLYTAVSSKKFSCSGANGVAACDLSDLLDGVAPAAEIEAALAKMTQARTDGETIRGSDK